MTSETGEGEKSQQSGARAERVPELTWRVIVLGILLSAVLSAANAYLGLFAGMTVSASIPAAVISMGLLRAFGGSILENNLVQTAASAGESAAAGAIFTLPALILLGTWAHFDLWMSAALIFLGGILGVLFTIFLRRALVVEGSLPFPEGVATAEVLRAGHSAARVAQGESAKQSESSDGGASNALSFLVGGSLLGAGAKLVESGFGWARSLVEGAVSLKWGTFYGGFGVSPSLAAVGYVVGFHVSLLIFLGGVINWVFVLPFVAEPTAGQDALELAWSTWSQKTRYLGVGAMTVGGLGALFEVRHSMIAALRATREALGRASRAALVTEDRERDLPPRFVVATTGLSLIPLYFLFQSIVGNGGVSCLLSVLVLVFGFLFSSVAAYMAGLVGSSHNPVSGVTIATILFSSLLLAFLGAEAVSQGTGAAAGPAAAILVGSVVCTAAAIGGDNMQDLKAGSLLGATPARQQIMQLLGVTTAALCLGPVLELLHGAYGFGAPSEAFPQALRAPQATLMASVAEGVFGGSLPWKFFFAGAGIGLGIFVLDLWLQRSGAKFRTPVLAVALGLYLPWELSGPVLLGGLVRLLVERRAVSRKRGAGAGILAAAGLITGEALMGIVLAAVVASLGGLDVLTLGARIESPWLSIAILLSALFFLRLAAQDPG